MKENKEYILAYGFAGKLLDALSAVTKKEKVGLVLIGDQELDQIVEDLLLKDEESFTEVISSADSYELELEHLLFVNFTQESLMHFIDKLKAEGISVPYKALLTEHNRKWFLRDLIEANRQEHLFVKLYHSSKNVLKIAVDVYATSKDAPLLAAMDNLQQQIEAVEIQGEMPAEEEANFFEKLRLSYNSLAERLNTLMMDS